MTANSKSTWPERLIRAARFISKAIPLRATPVRKKELKSNPSKLQPILGHLESSLQQLHLQIWAKEFPSACIFSTDSFEHISRWTQASEHLFGHKRNEILAKPLSILFPMGSPYHRDCENPCWEAASEHSKVHFGWMLKKDGSPFWARCSFTESPLSPINSSSGKNSKSNLGFEVFVEDVSHLKRLERERESALSTADQALKSKSEFLANLGHEIRTPLAAILGFSELIQNPFQGPDDREFLIRRIKDNGLALTQTVQILQDLSCAEMGNLVLEPTSVALPDFLSQVCVDPERRARAKGLHFNIQVEGRVPSQITTDPARLAQILKKLLDNAIYFSSVGGINLILRFTECNNSRQGSRMTFTIKDTGIGLNAEQRANMFQPVSLSGDSNTHRVRPTGMGLTLARHVARLLGGDLFLSESLPGRGATFLVTIAVGKVKDVPFIAEHDLKRGTLDLKIEQEPEMKPRPIIKGSNLATPDFRGALRGKKLLVAEDNPDIQALVSRILRLTGAEVLIAANGMEAILVAQEHKLDLILMDIQMPIQNGYEATKAIREDGFTRPILALTSRSLADERQKCLQIGCDDYLCKPIATELLLTKVISYLQPNVLDKLSSQTDSWSGPHVIN